jgi:hypothetical protein
MTYLKEIDQQLSRVAKELNAYISKDRIEVEERRIDWTEDGIQKAIIIQPVFEDLGVNHSLWNFINFAWIDLGIPEKFLWPRWEKRLAARVELDYIIGNIEELLSQSIANLKSIDRRDLQPLHIT